LLKYTPNEETEKQQTELKKQATDIRRDIDILARAANGHERERVMKTAKKTMIGLNTLGILAKDSGMEEEAYSLQNATKCFMSATYIRVEETTESNVEYDKTVTSIKDAIKDLSETANRLKLKAEHDVEEMNKGVDKDTEKTLKMRANIVKELFETENNYLDNLKFILKFFVTPFKELSGEGDKDSKKVLSHDAIQCVLEALPTIVDLTTKIRSDILSRMASNDPDLGSIFLEHAPLLSVYSDYVNNYGVASTKLREGRKKSRAVDKLLKKLEDQGETQDFDFYLIIPIQRPPRSPFSLCFFFFNF